MGTEAWLNEQLNMPETPVPSPGTSDRSLVQAPTLSRMSAAPDQLRQRVVHALSQILVVSLGKNNYPDEIPPHLRSLSRHALGNYRILLGEVAQSSPMGKHLDLANSNKPSRRRRRQRKLCA